MAGDRERCLDADMNDHVAKPINPDDLWRKLQRWIAPDPNRTGNLSPGEGASEMSGESSPAVQAARAFADIPGLDVAIGLRQAMGRDALYISLLRRFVVGQSDFAVRMASALQTEDRPAGELLAHTLKGVAAQVGAGLLGERAASLEMALRQGEAAATLHAGLADITALLDDLLPAIAARLPGEVKTGVATAVDASKTGEICSRLAGQLQAADFLCTNTLHEHADLLRGLLGEQFALMQEAVENYDFDGALALLKAATAQRDTFS